MKLGTWIRFRRLALPALLGLTLLAAGCASVSGEGLGAEVRPSAPAGSRARDHRSADVGRLCHSSGIG